MDAVIAGQGSGILANPVIERIARPTSDEAGRRVPSMRFGDPRVQALAGCLTVWDFAVSGITNKRLRAWMTGLLAVPYSMNQASYDLARLRRNGLIERIARTSTYRLTADGLTFALVYSRVHDKVLYPLTAHDQPIAAPTSDARHEPLPNCRPPDQHRLKTQDKRQNPRAPAHLAHKRRERWLVDSDVGSGRSDDGITVNGNSLYVLVTWNPSAEGPVGRRPSSPARIPT